MADKQIKTLKALYNVASNKKAVVVPKDDRFKKPIAAAFLIGMPGRVILNLFNKGMFIYKKKKK